MKRWQYITVSLWLPCQPGLQHQAGFDAYHRIPVCVNFCLCCALAIGFLFPAAAAAATEFESPLPPFQPRLDSNVHQPLAHQPLARRSLLAPKPGTPPRSEDQKTLLNRSNAQEIKLSSSNEESSQGIHQAIELPCDINEFQALSGDSLVEYVRGVTLACVNGLFSVEGEFASLSFDEANIIAVADSLAENATTYPGFDNNGILNEITYLRAYYFVQFYDPAVAEFGNNIISAVTSALQTFFNNAHLADVSDAHGEVLREALILVDSAELVADFLSVYIVLLDSFDSSFTEFFSMTAAINEIYFGLFRVRQYDPAGYQSVNDQHQTLIDALNDFVSRNTDLAGTTSAYVWNNAGGEIARFLQDGDAVAALAQGYVVAILGSYDHIGDGAGLYLYTAEVALQVEPDNCSLYNICNLVEQVDVDILQQSIECDGSLLIRSQNLGPLQQQQACDVLLELALSFHQQLATNQIPIINDNNTMLEMDIFDSADDYGIYGRFIFGIDTDNGGIYLEGEPSDLANQARFIAYEDDSESPQVSAGIRNLKHEYVHYLDGRFNTEGGFAAIVETNIVWWVEGLAEYIPLGTGNTEAINTVQTETRPLSTIFQTTYSDSQSTIYGWGYLAVRFFFEEKMGELDTMLNYFRMGAYVGESDSYASLIADIGTSLDTEFESWLASLLADDIRLGGFNLFEGISAGGGIGAQLQSDDNGISFFWDDPGSDNFALYLKVNGNADSFLFQVFPEGMATIDYGDYGLGGDELLEGYFVLYGGDGNFISQAATFYIDLEEINTFLQTSRLQRYSCSSESVALIVSVDDGERALLELQLIQLSPPIFQAQRVTTSLMLGAETNVANFTSADGMLVLPNLTTSCDDARYSLRLQLFDAEQLLFEIPSGGITPLID